jgi:hypothetical protein
MIDGITLWLWMVVCMLVVLTVWEYISKKRVNMWMSGVFYKYVQYYPHRAVFIAFMYGVVVSFLFCHLWFGIP